MKVAKVNFNDCIGKDLFFGGISEDFVRYCVEGPASFDPAAIPAMPEEVELHFFNCPGGEVYEGYAIYSYLRDVAKQGTKVTAYVHGLCASIASLIVLAADTRYIGELGTVMVHKPLVDAGPWANADDHLKAAQELDKIQAQVAAVYASRTGQPLEALHGMMNAETFLTADMALASGFATARLEDAPAAEVAATPAKVLNYAKVPIQPTPAAMATMTTTEEQSLFTRFANWLKNEPKNEGEAAPAATPTSAAYAVEVEDGDPMYVDTSDDGLNDIDQGDAVYSDEALTTAYPDGDYTLADGRAATVAGGVVTVLADAAATDEATDPAPANTADLDAANARIAELEGALNVSNRKVTGLQNKLNKVVPGSAGNPTPSGAAQNIIRKPGAAPVNAASPISFTRPTK